MKPLDVEGFDMRVGERRTQGFQIHLEGAAVSAQSATYMRALGGTMLDTTPIAAVVSGNKVYADVEAGNIPGLGAAFFTFVLGSQTVIAKVSYHVMALL